MSHALAPAFSRRIEPVLADLGRLRGQHLGLFFGVWVAALVFTGVGAPVGATAMMVCLLLGVGGAAVGSYFIRKRYVASYKQQLVTQLVRHVLPGMRFEPTGGLPIDAFRESGLYPGAVTDFKTEDLVSGEVDGRRIAFCDAFATHKYDNHDYFDSDGDGQRIEVKPVFRGIFVEAALEPAVEGHVQVVQDVAERMLGGVGAWMQSKNDERPPVVRFDDDAQFEHRYAVYTNDEAAARRLLTAERRKQLLALDDAHKGIRIAFAGNRLFITLPTLNDNFEPALFFTSGGQGEVEALARQFVRVVELVQALDLRRDPARA